MESTKQIKKFDAEIDNILNLMINSIYTNKEIFIRELISNASDACDKLRYQAINNPKLLNKENDNLKIQIFIDKKNKSISIIDNGLGMNREDLINNLGTIASSGTRNFLKEIKENKKNLDLIGQFGVGFYSAYMVSDIVTVFSTKADEKNGYKWVSDGKGEYLIEKLTDSLKRGTKITLKIKESESEFLELYRIRQIINTYCDHIAFPIELLENNSKPEVVNKAAAIWMRNPSEIKEKEYEEFYKHVSHLSGKPFMTLHNKIEGIIEYINLLFIPDMKPYNILHPDRKTKVKLYIKRVFISQEGNELIPNYLRFLRGIVDSEDLPLNISRETLQQNKTVKKINHLITKKVLSSLKKKAMKEAKEYSIFWKNFGDILKEGLCESSIEEKNMLLEICRFQSTISENSLISLDDYIGRMISGQEKIYFLNGNDLQLLKNNPHLEGFKKHKIEVLLLDDHVDNFWVNITRTYKNKDLKCITNEKIDLNKISNNVPEKKNIENLKKHSKIINFSKKVLNGKVKDVVISSKLINSPACLSTVNGGMNPRIEKLLIEQKQLNSKSIRILEINPEHEIFQKINNSLLNLQTDNELNKIILEVIYVQACLIEGDSIQDPNDFANKLNFLLKKCSI